MKVDIKMYMSEISKSKVPGLKAQKKIILWTLKHVSAISEHPVVNVSFYYRYYCTISIDYLIHFDIFIFIVKKFYRNIDI